jgi:hypothetical protein
MGSPVVIESVVMMSEQRRQRRVSRAHLDVEAVHLRPHGSIVQVQLSRSG